jgi:hypothetical protein
VTVNGDDRTARRDRLVAAAKMKLVTSRLLLREHSDQRAAKIYAASVDGLHQFNETQREGFKGLGDVRVADPH